VFSIRVLNIMHHAAFDGNFFRIMNVSKLISNKVQTIVVMPNYDKEPAIYLNKEKIKVYVIPFQFPIERKNPFIHIKWFFMLFSSIYSLILIVKNEKIDIIHVNGMLNVQGFITGILTKKKIILHLNDMNTPRIIVKLLMPIMEILADCIAVSSNYLRNYYFLKRINKTITLYPPVDPYKFNPELISLDMKMKLKNELKIGNNHQIIGIIGSINPSKGLEYFISSASKVKKMHTGLKFIIVGPEVRTKKNYYSEIKQMVKNLGLERNFIFTGLRKDIPELLSIFDTFVLTSTHEACGMVVLEAMAMEKPIVATAVGGVPELIINNITGVLVPPRDTKRIAEAIYYLFKNPNKAKNLGRGARKRVIKLFSLETCARKHIEIYKNTVRERK